LPHWEKGGATYCLTFSARRGQHFDAQERAIILASCRFGHPERWVLHAVVVMPDHVHMLLTPQRLAPNAPQWFSLAEIVKGIKSVTARKIVRHRGGKGGSIWQEEYYDHLIRDPEDFAAELSYLLQNPVKQGLAPKPADWDGLWVGNLS
jgi:REP element-mobilizing transposase RayT